MNLLKIALEAPHYILYTIIGLAGIGFLIGIHELGHFLFAKLFKVRTPSFSIGFGPQLISRKIGDTLFSLSAIPLGGYVEVSGMGEIGQGEQKEAQNTGADSFGAKRFYQKMLILFGGILNNLLFAYLSLILLFIIGAPKTELLNPLGITIYKPVIQAIAKDSPAEHAGLKAGQEITKINNIAINGDAKLLAETIKAHPGESVTLTVQEPESATGTAQDIQITLGSREITENGITKHIGIWGALLEIDRIPTYSFGQAVMQGIHATNTYIYTTMLAFKNMFIKRDIAGVGGPIMIIKETIKGAQKGFKIFLLFLAIISINLAVLNLIPLPILDGGQIMFVTIEAILGKQLPKLREYIHIISWVLILALFVYLTIRDLGIIQWFNLG